MNAKITEISPHLHSISSFYYDSDGSKFSRMNMEKTQYVYRFLCFTGGRVDVLLGDKRYNCCAGDVLYLTPGEKYRLVPTDFDFSLYNVFFDFFPVTVEGRAGKDNTCIFVPYHDSALCSPSVAFEDAAMFDKGGVFKDADCAHVFDSILTTDRADPYYDFYAKNAICSAVAQILQSERRKIQRVNGTEQILTYINLNPEKDLSGDTLSLLFSYHKNHINYLVKNATGLTLSEYVRGVKISTAKMLLSEGELSPSVVASELGYYDYSHFYKAFRDETGMSPKEYLKK